MNNSCERGIPNPTIKPQNLFLNPQPISTLPTNINQASKPTSPSMKNLMCRRVVILELNQSSTISTPSRDSKGWFINPFLLSAIGASLLFGSMVHIISAGLIFKVKPIITILGTEDEALLVVVGVVVVWDIPFQVYVYVD